MANSNSDAVASGGPPARSGLAPWALAWPVAVFVVLTLFLAGDLAADLVDGVGPTHMLVEIGAFLVALLGIVGTGKQLRRALSAAGDLQRDLQGTRVQLERSRSEAEALLRRVGKAIEGHFTTWGLTSAEREIALLILKGLSYKQIAAERGTTERTVRHQALGICRKAGVAGRAEMAAFFLQDMLVSAGRAARPPGSEDPGEALDSATTPAPFTVSPTPVPSTSGRTPTPIPAALASGRGRA